MEFGIVAPGVVVGVVGVVVEGVVPGMVVAGVELVGAGAGPVGAPTALALIAANTNASAASRPEWLVLMLASFHPEHIFCAANAARKVPFRELQNSSKAPQSAFAVAAGKQR